MIEKEEFYYYPAKENRTLHIYLPNNYYECDERYPVMYFFDGQNLFEDYEASFGTSWGMEDFLDNWDKNMIIVGIECSCTGDNRLSEYLPYKVSSGFLKDKYPMGDETMAWIINDLKPYIDNKYRTYGHREATGIGGSSMGGLMAVYGVCHYNSVFSKGACISSSIGFCFPSLMRDMDNLYIDSDTRVFLSWGTKETRDVKNHHEIDCHSYTYRRNKAVANKLEKVGAIPQLWCQLGGRHSESSWRELLPFFFNFLWK